MVAGRDDASVQVPATGEELSAPLLRDAVVQAALRAGDGVRSQLDKIGRDEHQPTTDLRSLVGRVPNGGTNIARRHAETGSNSHHP